MAFNQLDDQQLAQHVTILGWLHVVDGLITMVIGGCAFTFLTGIGLISGEPEAFTVLGFMSAVFCGFLWLLSLPSVIAGAGLITRQPWARILALIVGFFDLFSVPIGTLLGLYTFWVLLQANAPDYFERAQAPVRGSHEYEELDREEPDDLVG